MSSSPRFVAFGGSRRLPLSAWPFVARVVSPILRRGFGVSVGCAFGADAAVIAAVIAARSPSLRVFAVGGPSGAGFPSRSLPPALAVACVRSRVRWWSGGPPSLPLPSRLRARSRASVAGAAAAVFFVSSSRSPGSLGAAAAAARLAIPVFVFPVGIRAGAIPPLRGLPGRWLPSSPSGAFPGAIRWVTA